MYESQKCTSSFYHSKIALATKSKLLDSTFSTTSHLFTQNNQIELDSRFNAVKWISQDVLIGAMEDGDIIFFQENESRIKILKRFKQLTGKEALTIDVSNHIIVVAGSSGRLVIFNKQDVSKPYSTGIKETFRNIRTVKFNPAVSHILAVGCAEEIVILDLKQKRVITRIAVKGLRSLCWHPEVRTSLVVSSDCLYLLDLGSSKWELIGESMECMRVKGGMIVGYGNDKLYLVELIKNKSNNEVMKSNNEGMKLNNEIQVQEKEINEEFKNLKINESKNEKFEINKQKKTLIQTVKLEGVCEFNTDDQLSMAVISTITDGTKIIPINNLFRVMPVKLRFNNPVKFLKSTLVGSKDCFKVKFTPIEPIIEVSQEPNDKFEMKDPVLKYLLGDISEEIDINRTISVPISYFLKSDSLPNIIENKDPITQLLLCMERDFYEGLQLNHLLVTKILQKQNKNVDKFIGSLDTKRSMECFHYLGEYEKYLKVKRQEMKVESLREFRQYLGRLGGIEMERREYNVGLEGMDEYEEYLKMIECKGFKYSSEDINYSHKTTSVKEDLIENGDNDASENVRTNIRESGDIKKEGIHLLDNESLNNNVIKNDKKMNENISNNEKKMTLKDLINKKKESSQKESLAQQSLRYPPVGSQNSTTRADFKTSYPNNINNNSSFRAPMPNSNISGSRFAPPTGPNMSNFSTINSPTGSFIPRPSNNVPTSSWMPPPNANSPSSTFIPRPNVATMNPSAISSPTSSFIPRPNSNIPNSSFIPPTNITNNSIPTPNINIGSPATSFIPPNVSNVPNVSNIPNVSNVPNVSNIPNVTNVPNVSNIPYSTIPNINSMPNINSIPNINSMPNISTNNTQSYIKEKEKQPNDESITTNEDLKSISDFINKLKEIALSKKGIIFKARINEALQRLSYFDKNLGQKYDRRFLEELKALLVLDFETKEQRQAHLEIVRRTMFTLSRTYGKQQSIEIWLPGLMTLMQIALSE